MQEDNNLPVARWIAPQHALQMLGVLPLYVFSSWWTVAHASTQHQSGIQSHSPRAAAGKRRSGEVIAMNCVTYVDHSGASTCTCVDKAPAHHWLRVAHQSVNNRNISITSYALFVPRGGVQISLEHSSEFSMFQVATWAPERAQSAGEEYCEGVFVPLKRVGMFLEL